MGISTRTRSNMPNPNPNPIVALSENSWTQLARLRERIRYYYENYEEWKRARDADRPQDSPYAYYYARQEYYFAKNFYFVYQRLQEGKLLDGSGGQPMHVKPRDEDLHPLVRRRIAEFLERESTRPTDSPGEAWDDAKRKFQVASARNARVVAAANRS